MESEPQPFGKYLLLDRIAAGGMAEIYRAQLNAVAGVTKSVVIKKILPHYAGNKNFVSMFINEAKIAVGLSHGNIAQVFDFGEIEGEYFLAMELVHGQALSRVMRRARQMGLSTLPVPFALYITLELCKGLHYAHTRLDETGAPLNIVHRDVSPQNVILSYEGQVKIVDFGIAKARVATQTETQAGAVKGKYTYFAPEQARGKPLDARTDVFAAGIVLYEMVCGRLPFEGKMVDVLTRIVRGEFPRPRTLNPDVPREVEKIILTAMSTDQATRYPSAEAFQEAVATCLYTSAPTFSSSTMSQLMSYLFEQELTEEGRKVQLPRDFAEQLAALRQPSLHDDESTPWQRGPSSGRGSKRAQRKSKPDEETDRQGESRSGQSGRSSTTGRESGTQQDTARDETRATSWHTEAQSPPIRSRIHGSLGRVAPRWVFLSVPLLATLLAAGVVFLVGHFSTFAVQLTSSPEGARVKVDGRLSPMVTPLLISDLSSDRPHVIEVSAPSRKPWRKEITPVRGRTVSVHATLDPVPATSRPAAEVKPQEPPAFDDVRGQGTYTLLTSRHAFAIPGSSSARFRLDPRKSYRIWTEGKLHLANGSNGITECLAYLDVDSPRAVGDSTVVLGKKPITVQGAATLYAFLPDERVGDNSGSLQVRIQEKGAKDAFTLLLDGRRNAIALPSQSRLKVSDLDPSGKYEILVRAGSTEPRVTPAERPLRVVSFQSSGGREPVEQLRVLSLEGRYEVSNASSVTFFIADDVVAGNTGSVDIRVMRLTSRSDSTSNIRILPRRQKR